MDVRYRLHFVVAICLTLACLLSAQSNDKEGPIPVQRVPVENAPKKPKDNRKEPPRSDELAPDESSSKQTAIDVSAPKGDEKHPGAAESDLDEFHPWDPHKAAKCIEVGDYYYKQGNLRAALSRYEEALQWKPRDAEATYKLGEVQEKSGDFAAAMDSYQAYLKILPGGPFAAKAQQGIVRLKPKVAAAPTKPS